MARLTRERRFYNLILKDSRNDVRKKKRININLVVACITVFSTVSIFLLEQYSKDKRKYLYAYFDERYETLKSITSTMSEINTILTYKECPDDNTSGTLLNDSLIQALGNKTTIFSYTYLILNPYNSEDVILQSYFNEFESTFKAIRNAVGNNQELVRDDFYELDSITTKTIRHIGAILRKERDTIRVQLFK